MMGDITDGLFGDNLDTLDINFDNFDLDLMMDDDDDEDTSLTGIDLVDPRENGGMQMHSR